MRQIVHFLNVHAGKANKYLVNGCLWKQRQKAADLNIQQMMNGWTLQKYYYCLMMLYLLVIGIGITQKAGLDMKVV